MLKVQKRKCTLQRYFTWFIHSDPSTQGGKSSWWIEGYITEVRCFCSISTRWIKQSHSWGFTSHSTARVILGQAMSIITYVSHMHIKMTGCDKMQNLLATRPQQIARDQSIGEEVVMLALGHCTYKPFIRVNLHGRGKGGSDFLREEHTDCVRVLWTPNSTVVQWPRCQEAWQVETNISLTALRKWEQQKDCRGGGGTPKYQDTKEGFGYHTI